MRLGRGEPAGDSLSTQAGDVHQVPDLLRVTLL